ncbi:MAG: DUF1045 domain-containing protein [Pseudomonadota bacterium]
MSGSNDRGTPGPRHAVYWAPEPTHLLWQAGCAWLGRDPSGRLRLDGDPQRPTTEPRRYGFHATLKAPFRLAPHACEADLLSAVQALAARTPVFPMPALQVRFHEDYLALQPIGPIEATHPLRRLADACVSELDRWRAPLTEADTQRRLQNSELSAEHLDHLHRWGYPHVFDQWRFHMTLSDSLPLERRAERDALEAQARQFFALALRVPLTCSSLCVFTEPAPGQPFRLAHRWALQP